MSILEDLADKLAQDALAAAEESGDDTLIEMISRELGSSSQTTQEAFNTAIRMRTAEARARAAMREQLTKAHTSADT